MVEMYRQMTRVTAGGRIVECDGLTLCETPLGTVTTNMAIVCGRPSADAVATATAEVYRGRPFSVWTRAHVDGALEDALRTAGWLELASSPGMSLSTATTIPPVQAPLTVRPVSDDADRAAYAAIMAEAYALYGAPVESTEAFFAALASVCGPTTQAFVGWCDGAAVAGAMLYVSHGIGGVGWVGTRPAAFSRGFGATVTWAVVAEAQRRGVPFVSLQASPMGAPVYRRMGFDEPTAYRMFVAPF